MLCDNQFYSTTIYDTFMCDNQCILIFNIQVKSVQKLILSRTFKLLTGQTQCAVVLAMARRPIGAR